ncbi:hypothetical protein AHAS_Ahas15G0190200 [Arachis hypogaea]
MKKEEVVEVIEPELVYPQKPFEVTREHENSQPSQTSLNQNISALESMIERYEEEMKKSWEEQQTSSMKVLLSQMLSAKEEVEEQETLDEENTPTITQPPSFEFKEVKAINNNTEERIVTKLPLNISRKKERSTISNPTPEPPARKLNQAIHKKKLARKRPRMGALTGYSLPLRSFLLTNWKKRKKVISYRKSFNLLEEKIHHHGQKKDMEPNNDDDTEETNGLQEVMLFSD